MPVLDFAMRARNNALMTGDDNQAADAERRSDALRRARRFGLCAAAIAASIIIALAIAARFEVFGAGLHAILALALGVGGTIALGVGLMALSFYSSRSGADDAVEGMDETIDR